MLLGPSLDPVESYVRELRQPHGDEREAEGTLPTSRRWNPGCSVSCLSLLLLFLKSLSLWPKKIGCSLNHTTTVCSWVAVREFGTFLRFIFCMPSSSFSSSSGSVGLAVEGSGTFSRTSTGSWCRSCFSVSGAMYHWWSSPCPCVRYPFTAEWTVAMQWKVTCRNHNGNRALFIQHPRRGLNPPTSQSSIVFLYCAKQ